MHLCLAPVHRLRVRIKKCEFAVEAVWYGGPGGHAMRRYLSADGDVTVDGDDATVDDDDVTVDDGDMTVDDGDVM